MYLFNEEMKRFITPFFGLIKTDQNLILSSVEDEYDEFALFLYKESSKKSSGKKKLACYNALVYTHTELDYLLEVIEKKSAQAILKKAIRLVTKWIEFMETQMFLNLRKGAIAIHWTGSKVEFVEFVYAIYCVGCVNNGEISLKEIFQLMCKTFNIEANDYARIFVDIKNRNGNDRTKFLNLTRRSLTQYMEIADQRPPRK
jgi:hypothetical protein